MSSGHHQLVDSCNSCHTDAFGGGEVLQDACVACHGDDRRKPFDSHPIAKFKDPRNASRLEKINATQCVSCHTEHRPEITLANGLTQPRDVCFHCHENVAEERPSHTGMEFADCTTSGCHNYHDNRALYTDFLVKHMDQAEQLDVQRVKVTEFLTIIDQIVEYPIDRYPVEPLTITDIDVPSDVSYDDSIANEWSSTAHAAAGVNCSSCHERVTEDKSSVEWVNDPELQGCTSCHGVEVDDFQQGKHGMRHAAGLSPMTPEGSRLPMTEGSGHLELDCNSCHEAHRFDRQTAAVESCLGCHADNHSLAYKQSRHYALWQAEMSGVAEPRSGVSCASCHMPRVEKDVSDWLSRVTVEHNQSEYFAPNSKMIRPVCQDCHGLPFSIDALADEALIETNFQGEPSVSVESVSLAREDAMRHQKRKDQGN
ncbi:MAG: cytochrome c3 family protein [Granulosicoccus sp.]